MAIPIQEATKVIKDMAQLMNPEPDFVTIVAAEEAFTRRDALLKKELDETHATLRALAKTLEAARASSKRSASVPSAQDHEETLQNLDANRIALAKAISETEGLLDSKENELAALKENARALEEYDPAAEHENKLDGAPLRLQLYKRIGFEPLVDKKGVPSKFFIRTSSRDIQVVDIHGEPSSFQRCNSLWQIAGS